jgi:CRP/FNR family cyclic AMP-dependent transcriptional regulator
MATKRTPDSKSLFPKITHGKTVGQYEEGQVVFSQGDAADSVFHIEQGKVQLTVVSRQGKEAVLAILNGGSFFGEGCLTGQPVRMVSAVAIQESTLTRFNKDVMIRLLQEDRRFAGLFTSYLLTRTIRVEEDLMDQLFNSSEKRLARILLLLAHFGKEGEPKTVLTEISQATLAGMVGTTRARINFFMNKFRKLGFIEYNGGLKVHSGLLNVVLHD